ncbi:MAG: PilZ domain-containing protein [Candidatus Omnitrophota bacterium]
MERNKRRFKRFDAYMSVKFTGTESTSVRGIGLSRDLCCEGLKINSDKSLQAGTPLNLEITIPDDPKPIFSSGLVMWSKSSEGENQGYDQGVRLLNIDPVDKFRVLDYAYNHWLETKISDYADPENAEEW